MDTTQSPPPPDTYTQKPKLPRLSWYDAHKWVLISLCLGLCTVILLIALTSLTQYVKELEQRVFVPRPLPSPTKTIMITIPPTPIESVFQTPAPPPTTSISIPSQTISGWETYTDPDAGFSVQYRTAPEGTLGFFMRYTNVEPGKGVKIETCHQAPDKGTACIQYYTVHVYNNYDGASRRAWLQNSNLPGTAQCALRYADVYMAQKNALLATGECGSWGLTYILVPSGNRMYVFELDWYSFDVETQQIVVRDDYREILSTFRLL